MINIGRAIKNLLSKKQDIVVAIPGVLGDKTGVVNTDRKNYVYARVGNAVISVFNNRVNAQYGLPVMIGYDPAQPGLLQVLSIRDVSVGGNTQYQVPAHHENHEYPHGNDIVYMQLRQFLPLRITPLGGFKVAIYRAIVWGSSFKVVDDTLDLFQYCPLQPHKACYVLITVSNDGSINVTKGNEVNISTLSLSDIPQIPATAKYVVGAIRLYASQTEIKESGTDTDIVDLRFPLVHKHCGEDITSGTISANRLPLFTATEPGAVPAPGTVSNKVLRDDGTWVSVGTGDMTKAVYDTDNDGMVDAAESVPWSGVTGKPSTYPPDTHNHAASDITSGTLDAARIPNLNASKITSGYFGNTTAIAVRVIRTSHQSIPNATWTAVSFSQATFDDRPSGFSAHWDGGTRLYCRVAGTHFVYGNVMFDTNTNGDRIIGIRLNGSQFWFASNTRALASLSSILNVAGLIKLNAGDYIELMVYQNSGGNLNITYDSSVPHPHSPAFGMARIA